MSAIFTAGTSGGTHDTVAQSGRTLSIHLTAEEEVLFQLLQDTAVHQSRGTVLRVAGGWVRDKVLGNPSDDIDIAVDNQSGLQFATAVNALLAERGQETHTVAVIQANPEQSKHLETATVRVLGFEIDFVNLRAETYADTRIPEVRIGTALEDAQRRDFTINTLFYNISTRQVEDLTERGIDDLTQGIIRTPITPHATFMDDPLRVLRAIRFASRLQFRLESELCTAARSSVVRMALMQKVSRERILKECDGCLSKPTSRPCLAFSEMYSLGLLSVVLPVNEVPCTAETQLQLPLDWESTGVETMVCLNALLSVHQQLNQIAGSARDVNEGATSAFQCRIPTMDMKNFIVSATVQLLPKSIHFCSDRVIIPDEVVQIKALWWAALLIDLRHLKAIEKNKQVPFITVLLRAWLKMDNAMLKSVSALVECVDSMTALAAIPESATIDDAGAALRQCKGQWRHCLLLACAAELRKAMCLPASTSRKRLSSESTSCGVQVRLLDDTAPYMKDLHLGDEELRIISRYRSLEERIDEMGLDGVWLLKPLINGSELIRRLGLPKGPAVGIVLEAQIKWQIRESSADIDACLRYLRDEVAPPLLSNDK